MRAWMKPYQICRASRARWQNDCSCPPLVFAYYFAHAASNVVQTCTSALPNGIRLPELRRGADAQPSASGTVSGLDISASEYQKCDSITHRKMTP